MQASRLPFSRKLAFAVGDFFGGGSFNIVNFLYPTFLTMMVGLSPYWVGVVMLVARIWDAVTDPLMGYISDATRSKMGKRRIYIAIAAPLALISFFLLFFPYSFSSTAARVSAVLASYILFCTVQTMMMIPYHSLASEISADYGQRASVNGLRLGFSIFASILCVAVPGIIVDSFADRGKGYIVMSLLFGSLFMLALLCTAFFVREEIITPPIRTRISLKAFVRPLSLPAYRCYLGMQLCLSMSMAVMSALFFFYVDFKIMREATMAGESNFVGMFAAALMFSMQIIALPFYLWLIKKTSKAVTYRIGAALWIVGGLAVFLLTPNTPVPFIYLLAAFLGFAISGPGLVPHTMFGDVMDAAQLAFGDRNEGAFVGLMNLINKTVQAVGIALVMAILGLCGFVEQALGAPPVLAQPLSAQGALTAMIALTPAVCMGIGIWISARYRIDKARQSEMAEELRKKQA
ncbi:MAG: MFS transporter [Firmicutes bacterium]|nr:MFS transporter [Bacillota bacterium]